MSGCFQAPQNSERVTMLNDREVLSRLIEYARAEAEGGGEVICAQLLSAALLALELSPEDANRWCLDQVTEPLRMT
ncbi:hypothetical protein [Acuticoccus sp. I52.16.1]|uniref:hypothetical protein n=1 Tax=Acuticoccus sp. I52.16.1 TaxID=2928472 RepID=UPI001FD2A636|nr:hypothetical protein [Acuticoccus sp. I52.16.1]UOM34131.1 hypothetical protein MRB58_20240 [Acuticoccus sp. I52.16.1]